MYDHFLIHTKTSYNTKEHCFLNNGNGMWKTSFEWDWKTAMEKVSFSKTKEIITLTH